MCSVLCVLCVENNTPLRRNICHYLKLHSFFFDIKSKIYREREFQHLRSCAVKQQKQQKQRQKEQIICINL